MYRTGDRVRLRADGTLEFLGRVDRQIKVRGVRIEPGEVESALMGHPGVAQAAVTVALAPGHQAAGDKRLVAHVVPRGGARLDPAELRAYAAERLPREMVPSAFAVLAALPTTRTGKVDVASLPPIDLAAPAGIARGRRAARAARPRPSCARRGRRCSAARCPPSTRAS